MRISLQTYFLIQSCYIAIRCAMRPVHEFFILLHPSDFASLMSQYRSFAQPTREGSWCLNCKKLTRPQLFSTREGCGRPEQTNSKSEITNLLTRVKNWYTGYGIHRHQ